MLTLTFVFTNTHDPQVQHDNDNTNTNIDDGVVGGSGAARTSTFRSLTQCVVLVQQHVLRVIEWKPRWRHVGGADKHTRR
jgi:hypothetical protein